MSGERVKPNGFDEVTKAILSEVRAQGVIPRREAWERYARAAVGVFLRVIDEEIEGWRGDRDLLRMARISALHALRARFEEADDED